MLFHSSGMGFRPMINVESTLIRFSADDPATYKDHIENLITTLKGRLFGVSNSHVSVLRIPLSLPMHATFWYKSLKLSIILRFAVNGTCNLIQFVDDLQRFSCPFIFNYITLSHLFWFGVK